MSDDQDLAPPVRTERSRNSRPAAPKRQRRSYASDLKWMKAAALFARMVLEEAMEADPDTCKRLIAVALKTLGATEE